MYHWNYYIIGITSLALTPNHCIDKEYYHNINLIQSILDLNMGRCHPDKTGVFYQTWADVILIKQASSIKHGQVLSIAP